MSHLLRIAIALDLAEPYAQHQDVFLGIRRYARDQPDWRYVVDECPGFGRRRGDVHQAYDGVIARASPQLQRDLHKRGIPLVNTWYQHATRGVPGVYQDAKRTGEVAADHLVDRGFRRLSVLCSERNQFAVGAARGFRQRGEGTGVDVLVRRVPNLNVSSGRDWADIKEHLTAWLDDVTPPVGLCLEEASLARMLISLCEARGWSVPNDVAIISLNDNRMIMELPPQITGIESNFERVGYEAAALLDRLLRGEPPPAEPLFIPPKGIAARQSTDYFAVEDEVVAAALRFISTRLSESLNVKRIADEVGVSLRALQLRFDAVLGRPISDEIRRLRLATAQRMLADPAKRIADIAKQAGLGTSTAMSHVFRRELGVNPRAYREQVLGERGE